MNLIRVSLVDDHALFRKGLGALIYEYEGYTVWSEASNGKEFVDNIEDKETPDIVLLDIDMPEMDGFETCQWLKTHYPEIKVLALSMYEDEQAILKMLQVGAKGYLLKNTTTEQLLTSMEEVLKSGYYYSDRVGKVLMSNIETPIPTINDTETSFLKLACTELTYKEIAVQLSVSPRTIDNYREILFEKLQVRSRIGLAIYTIKHGIFRP